MPQRLTQALVLSDRQSALCLTVPSVLPPGCTVVVPAWPLQFPIRGWGMGGWLWTGGIDVMLRSALKVPKLRWGKGI